jgi:hypothetical protein
VITTARAADSEICSKHAANSSLSSMSSALALPWVMVTVAMPLSFFRSIMWVSCLLGGDIAGFHRRYHGSNEL